MATPQPAKPIRPRPYRDFLTPALHRKFSTASVLALAVCYGEAIWMGEWDFFWQWFPIGFAGMRTLLIFISALSVFVLRVSRTHVGESTTRSPFETFYKFLCTFSTYQTFFWYLFSAALYSEVYTFSRPASAKMGIMVYGRHQERPRLNARSVCFRSLLFMLAISFSVYHLTRDVDSIPYPIRSTQSKKSPSDPNSPYPETTIATTQNPLDVVRRKIPKIAGQAFKFSLGLTLPGFVIWFAFFRWFSWDKFFSVARWIHFLPNSQRTNITSLAPILDLLGRVWCQSFLLVILWEFSNVVYSAYMSQEPLKKGKPLTNDSKDPNGSLLNGLKSRKQFAKATAFYELRLITSLFPDRRSLIYSELDRAGDSTWSQILALCVNEISSIQSNVSPPAPPPPAEEPAQDALPKKNKLGVTLKEGDIFAPSPKTSSQRDQTAQFLASIAQKHGNSPGAAPLKSAISYSSQKLLTNGQREKISPKHIRAEASGLVTQFVHSQAGWPFRIPFPRLVNSVIFNNGTGYSNVQVIVCAIESLAALIVASLKEDKYGSVAPSVPTVIRLYASTIQQLEGFLGSAAPHWSDIEFKEAQRKQVGDVNAVLDALKDGLEGIFGGFGEFLGGMGMGSEEVKGCKMVLGRRSEMRELEI